MSVSGLSERLTTRRVGNLVRHAATLTRSNVEEQEVIALLGLRLIPCHRSIVRLLQAYPLLSDEELAGLLGPERKSARSSPYELRAFGCLEPLSMLAGRPWRLCECGRRLIAVANHRPVNSTAENWAAAAKNWTCFVHTAALIPKCQAGSAPDIAFQRGWLDGRALLAAPLNCASQASSPT